MRKIKQGLLALTCVIFLGMNPRINDSVLVMVARAEEPVQCKETVIFRVDIIEWRYKVENGNLYHRQYNSTKGQWIGEWERC